MSKLPVPQVIAHAKRIAGRPLPVPLRPDVSVINDNSMRALARAVVSIGVNALNPSVFPGDYARRMWPHDRDVGLNVGWMSNSTMHMAA